MLYQKPPSDFNATYTVVSCFIECHGKILLLKRSKGKVEGEKWGVCAGKVENGETPLQAMYREVKKETRISR